MYHYLFLIIMSSYT